ncbi:transglutaminase family protein, partial [Burkholderia gladioli]
FFRDERMYLIPGDSPMGYRLPLDSLPWVSATDFPYLIDQDPFAPAVPLPTAEALRARYLGAADAPRYLAGQGGYGAQRMAAAPRTALQSPLDARDLAGRGGFGEPAGSAAGEGAARAPHEAAANRYPDRFESAAWITRTAL